MSTLKMKNSKRSTIDHSDTVFMYQPIATGIAQN